MTSSRATSKILVFEDTDSDFDDLKRSITAAGFHAVRARTAGEFRALSPWSGFALIIMDLFFGEGPEAEKLGIVLTHEVRAINSNIPIVVASSHSPERHAVADSFRAGAMDYIDKSELLHDTDGVLKRLLTRAILSYEDRGEEELPLPIAFLYRDFRRSKADPRRRVERMTELFEVTLKLITFTLMSAQHDVLRTAVPASFRLALERPSLGHLTKLLDAIPEPSSFVAGLARVVHKPRFRELCASLISVRNEYIGHGVSQSEAVYERLLTVHEPEMLEILKMSESLRNVRLIWIGSARAVMDDGSHEYEAKMFRGSNPEPVSERVLISRGVRAPAMLLTDWPISDVIDLFPWCQYAVCEQRCLNTKLFLFRLARHGELWLLDHIYGHALQTRRGWDEFRRLIGEDSDES